MKHFELEIPDRLIKKCHSIEEIQKWAKRLLIGDINLANVYTLKKDGGREHHVWRLIKNGLTCSDCASQESVIQFMQTDSKQIDHYACQHCGSVTD